MAGYWIWYFMSLGIPTIDAYMVDRVSYFLFTWLLSRKEVRSCKKDTDDE